MCTHRACRRRMRLSSRMLAACMRKPIVETYIFITSCVLLHKQQRLRVCQPSSPTGPGFQRSSLETRASYSPRALMSAHAVSPSHIHEPLGTGVTALCGAQRRHGDVVLFFHIMDAELTAAKSQPIPRTLYPNKVAYTTGLLLARWRYVN
jgi:hypothetical protein